MNSLGKNAMSFQLIEARHFICMYCWVLFCYVCHRGHVLSLLVGLSAGLHKNYGTDFHETWMEDGSQHRVVCSGIFSYLIFLLVSSGIMSGS